MGKEIQTYFMEVLLSDVPYFDVNKQSKILFNQPGFKSLLHVSITSKTTMIFVANLIMLQFHSELIGTALGV